MVMCSWPDDDWTMLHLMWITVSGRSSWWPGPVMASKEPESREFTRLNQKALGAVSSGVEFMLPLDILSGIM